MTCLEIDESKYLLHLRGIVSESEGVFNVKS